MVKVANSLFKIGQGGIKVVTSTIQLEPSEDVMVLVDATTGNIIVTLPTAIGWGGKRYFVKKTDSTGNTVTIQGLGSQTIEGVATQVLASQNETLNIASDNQNWVKIASGV